MACVDMEGGVKHLKSYYCTDAEEVRNAVESRSSRARPDLLDVGVLHHVADLDLRPGHDETAVELGVHDVALEGPTLVGGTRPVAGFDSKTHRRSAGGAGQLLELADDDVVHGPKDYPPGDMVRREGMQKASRKEPQE